VLVQLDDDLVERLDRIAEREGTSRSELLRRGATAVLDAADLARVDRVLQSRKAEETSRCPNYKNSPVGRGTDPTTAQLFGHFNCSVVVVGEAQHAYPIASRFGHGELTPVPRPGQLGTPQLR
jgi:hypothetical protein